MAVTGAVVAAVASAVVSLHVPGVMAGSGASVVVAGVVAEGAAAAVATWEAVGAQARVGLGKPERLPVMVVTSTAVGLPVWAERFSIMAALSRLRTAPSPAISLSAGWKAAKEQDGAQMPGAQYSQS